MDEMLVKLNEAQLEAVTATEGYVRVIAGAGSGKTRALSHRFAYLVEELGILPGNILCVTFTNKSAAEMRERIRRLTGDQDTGYINTFHGFCVSVLQEDSHAVGYPKSFLVLDNSDINTMLEQIYEERNLTLRDMTYGTARDLIEIRKTIREPEYYRDLIRMSPDTLREKYMAATDASDIIFYGYLYQEKKCFGLDYNDLIVFSLYIFEQNAEIREKWQKRLEYIMIDEFQDIDRLQYRLMEVLCGYHRNLFIVGDPDQTIYTWRGANVGYLLNFDQVFRPARTVMMMQNYRSAPQILRAANSLIDKNRTRMKKELIPVLPEGEPVVCHIGETSDKEASWIAEEVQRLSGQGTAFRDITVLYRAHYVTRAVEEAFLRAEIPYVIYSGVQFFDRAEIKDALSYLRMIALRDDLSFARIINKPRRNMGQRRMKFLSDYAEEHGVTLYEALKSNLEDEIFKRTGAAQFVQLIERASFDAAGRQVSEVLADILDKSGYEKALRTEGDQERLDNLAELRQSVYEYERSCGEECTLEHYLAHAALFSNQDASETGDKVKLMTVHSAKGLEFPYVFLCGMNEGIFPSRKVKSLPGMEEERRLAFVAMTRAEKKLYLTSGGGRNFDGSVRYPSRFILNIDRDLLEFTAPLPEGLLRETEAYIALRERGLTDGKEETDGARFAVGQKVRHRVFGDGVVESIDEDREAYVIRFEKMPTPRAIAFRVKMEKI